MALEKPLQAPKTDPLSFVSRKLGEIKGRSLLAVGRYLLVTGQTDARLFRRTIQELVRSQRPDGGFQRRTRGESSSILETAHAVQFVLSAGLARNSKVIRNALRFLKSGQKSDGGFSEYEKNYHQVTWLEKSVYVKKVSSPYITSAVLRAFLDAGIGANSPEARSGFKFLKETQKSDGGWELYRSNPESELFITAAIISKLGKYKIFREQVRFRDAISYVLRYQKHSGSFGDCLDGTLSALDALAEAGYDSRDKVVTTAINWVLQHQNPDGSLYDGDCEGQTGDIESVIRETIDAIITLSKLDVTNALKKQKPHGKVTLAPSLPS